MSIISHTTQIVNINLGSSPVSIPKFSEKKAESVAVARKLYKAGLPKRGERILSCNRELKILQCADCGSIEVVSASYCRDRLCPLCSWRLSIQRYARMRKILDVIASTSFQYSLITLTVKNCESGKLSEVLSSMSAAWADVRRQRWTHGCLAGWARSVEVTYNRMTRELHPHYHIIAVWSSDAQAGCKALIREWLLRASRHGLVVTAEAQDSRDIKEAGGEGASLIGAICETYKYTVKSKDLLDGVPLSVVYDIATGLDGKKLISLGGCIKQVAKELALEDIDKPEDESENIIVCKVCGSTALDELIVEWSVRSNAYVALTDQTADVMEVIKSDISR